MSVALSCASCAVPSPISPPLDRELTCIVDSSIYQDVPLHSLEEFKALAPEEARSDKVLEDEHQLMLNRLSFELAERQRYVWASETTFHPHVT